MSKISTTLAWNIKELWKLNKIYLTIFIIYTIILVFWIISSIFYFWNKSSTIKYVYIKQSVNKKTKKCPKPIVDKRPITYMLYNKINSKCKILTKKQIKEAISNKKIIEQMKKGNFKFYESKIYKNK